MDKNRRGLCYVMDQEDLTTMRIFYDFRTGEVYLSASKDWDDDLDWSAYNKSFYAESIKTHMPSISMSRKYTRYSINMALRITSTM